MARSQWSESNVTNKVKLERRTAKAPTFQGLDYGTVFQLLPPHRPVTYMKIQEIPAELSADTGFAVNLGNGFLDKIKYDLAVEPLEPGEAVVITAH